MGRVILTHSSLSELIYVKQLNTPWHRATETMLVVFSDVCVGVLVAVLPSK